MMLLAAFAGVSLLLATVGLYGVLAHAVSRRRHEIGVRIALGAASGRVLRMVVGQGMRLAVIGVVVGLGAAFFLSRWLESLVYEVSVTDPAVFAGVAAVLLVVSLVASWVPAGRATRVDPAEAFRGE
jgi:ABC-type antimicrobial peptide transport system permease subunit